MYVFQNYSHDLQGTCGLRDVSKLKDLLKRLIRMDRRYNPIFIKLYDIKKTSIQWPVFQLLGFYWQVHIVSCVFSSRRPGPTFKRLCHHCMANVFRLVYFLCTNNSFLNPVATLRVKKIVWCYSYIGNLWEKYYRDVFGSIFRMPRATFSSIVMCQKASIPRTSIFQLGQWRVLCNWHQWLNPTFLFIDRNAIKGFVSFLEKERSVYCGHKNPIISS